MTITATTTRLNVLFPDRRKPLTNLVDTVAKGGGLMIGVGPSPHGEFHPEAVRQMRGAGKWLQVNGEAI